MYAGPPKIAQELFFWSYGLRVCSSSWRKYFAVEQLSSSVKGTGWDVKIGLKMNSGNATEWAPRPIESIGRNFRLFVVCVSPPLATRTNWTEDFWSKSVLQKKKDKLNIYFGRHRQNFAFCFEMFMVLGFGFLPTQSTVHSGGDRRGWWCWWQVTCEKWFFPS